MATHNGAPFTPDNTEVATIATQNAVTSLTGDVTGTGPGATATTLANSGVSAGAYTSANITVDAKGRVTVAASGTGGITQLTGDVTAGPGTGSQAATLAAGSATVLNSGTLNAARLPAMTGDVTASVGTHATTLAAGSASVLNSGTLVAARMPALTGDITTTVGTVATTLATTGVSAASYVQANITVDAKGRLTAAATPTTNQTSAGGNVTDLSVNLPGSGPLWDFWGYMKSATGTALFQIEPNSLATNQTVEGFVGEGGGSAAKFKDTTAVFADGDAGANANLVFWGTIYYIPGIATGFTVDMIQTRTGDPIRQTCNDYWNVTTTPTSVRIHSDTASAILTTSVINARSRFG